MFAALLIILPLQAVLVGLIGLNFREPWPSITMPSFREVYPVAEGITMRKPEINILLADGSRRLVKMTDFLAGIPVTHQKAVYRSLFESGNISEPTTQLREWLRKRAGRMNTREPIVGIVVFWDEITVRRVDEVISAKSTRIDSVFFHFGAQ